MATDPTQRVREQVVDSPLDLDLQRALRRLAALEPSPAIPYLTIALDWRPDGQDPGRRPARQFIEQELDRLLGEREYRDPVAVSMRDDLELIRTFLDEDADAASQGIVIVACAARNVFETLQIGLPVESNVTLAPTPALLMLAKLAEDYEPYAVLLVDQHEATLSFIRQARRHRSMTLDGSEYPRKQATGGWSQRRFQSRADERVSAFAQDVAEEVRKALDEAGKRILVVAGDEVMTSALDEHFHQSVKDRIAGTMRIDIRASEQEVVELTMPLIEAFEREQEASAVRRLQESRGSGGLAALGSDDVLAALQAGQVMTLMMTDDYSQPGWADYSMSHFGTGDAPKRHPGGGDAAELEPIQIEEEVVRLALQTGADIEIVQAVVSMAEMNAVDMDIPEAGGDPPRTAPAQALDEFGGIGALLRYALSNDQSTTPT